MLSKKLVKKHVIAAAFEGLKEIQETHSKSKKLVYDSVKMQDYLSPENGMTNREKAWQQRQRLSATSSLARLTSNIALAVIQMKIKNIF